MSAPLNPDYISTTNGCKLCRPLGAALAFRGIEGCVPFLHGSQGCATYMRRYLISHFSEPVDIASSSLGEKNAIYGGGPNLKLGLQNVIKRYGPSLIGVASTCLTETIGDDLPMLVREYNEEFGAEDGSKIVTVSTPSYGGTHMEGFHAAMRAVVEQLTMPTPPHDGVTILGNMLSPADIRHLKDICASFGLDATLLPDYSETLDGVALNSYPLIPAGGTDQGSIAAMAGAQLTIELGATVDEKSAGAYLARHYGADVAGCGLPIGIRATDRFMALLSDCADKPMPPRYAKARGRLVDAMVDGHKYIFGKRAVIYGEQDLVAGLAGFLSEIGIHPVLCASGGKSGRFAQAISEAIGDIEVPTPEVHEGVDFYDIENRAAECGVDLVIGHSKGYRFARQHNLPIIRVGFPIHDRVGGQRLLHVGFAGAQRLFDEITNTIIARKQDSSPIGYSYM
jgi:nitrogenase molybdenum-iron protein NifN